MESDKGENIVQTRFKIDHHWSKIYQLIQDNPIVAIITSPSIGKTLRLPELIASRFFSTSSSTSPKIWVTVSTTKIARQSASTFSCLFPNTTVSFYSENSDNILGTQVIYISTKQLKRKILERLDIISKDDILMIDEIENGSLASEALYGIWSYLNLTTKLILVGTSITYPAFPSAIIYEIVEPSYPTMIQYHTRNYDLNDLKIYEDTLQVISNWIFSSTPGNLVVLVTNSIDQRNLKSSVETYLSELNFPVKESCASVMNEVNGAKLNTQKSLFNLNVKVETKECQKSDSIRFIYITPTLSGLKFENVHMMIDLCLKYVNVATPLGGVRFIKSYITKEEGRLRAEGGVSQTKDRLCYRMCTIDFYETFANTMAGEINRLPLEKPILECLISGYPVSKIYHRMKLHEIDRVKKDLIKLGFISNSKMSDIFFKLNLPIRLVYILFTWFNDGNKIFDILGVIYLIDSFMVTNRTSYFKSAPAIFLTSSENNLYSQQNDQQFFGRFRGRTSFDTLNQLWRIYLNENDGIKSPLQKSLHWCRINSIDEISFIQVKDDIDWAFNKLNEIGYNLVYDPIPESISSSTLLKDLFKFVYDDQVVVRQTSSIARIIYTDLDDKYIIDTDTIPNTNNPSAGWYIRLNTNTVYDRYNSFNMIRIGVGIDED